MKKGIGVGGVIEPPSAHAGVRRRAEAEVVAAVPIDEVVLPLIAGLCKVGDLVLLVAVVFQLLDGVEINVRRFVRGGSPSGGCRPNAESGSILSR